MSLEILSNISSGNGLLPDDTKPLPGKHWLIISEHEWQFDRNAQDIYCWFDLKYE